MSQFKSDFLNILSTRGFIHQISDPEGLDAAAKAGPITGYIGFDATASSLHAGSLVQIMMLRWMQKTGHKPIALMGGGTTKIGDPSFKDESRKLLNDEQIAANLAGIKQVFTKFLSFGNGAQDARMVNNADWLDHLNYIEFLRDYGVHFTINRMLSFDSVKLRLDREQPLTFLEFNYMILQAYDFLELSRREGCVLQMGGSDQWGNIVNGIELGRRCDQRQLYALTSPLLTTSSGAKMGKTAAGAVWLNAEMLSPYDYWQYWRNCEDADVTRFLKLYTEMPLAEIEKLGGSVARKSMRRRRCSRQRPPPCCTGGRRRNRRPRRRGVPSRKVKVRKDCRRSRWTSTRAPAFSLPAWRQASRHPTAKRGARYRAARCGSTTSPWRTKSSRSPATC